MCGKTLPLKIWDPCRQSAVFLVFSLNNNRLYSSQETPYNLHGA